MDKKRKEFTVTSIIIGIILAVVFSGANAYLGLRVGMTVSASIPAAVVSMGIIRIILKRESILENNIVQTIGSAGESIASGAIFTMPAMFMWANEWGDELPSFFEITFISLCGGILGVLFMIPLRKMLIVKDDIELPYPEGKACAEVLLAAETGNKKAGVVFMGLSISGIYKFLCDGLNVFKSEFSIALNNLKGAAIGIDMLPALSGVGYICGFKISAYMLGGGILSWLVLMPIISGFGGDAVIYPSDIAVSTMEPTEIWSNYIRYIGAGAVAMGGIISLIKAIPLIYNTFINSMASFNKNNKINIDNSQKDLPIWFIILGILVVIFLLWLIPIIPVNFIGAIIIAIMGFFFATVSSRLVGMVGSSNNPVSGMTIATLIACTVLFKFLGNTGTSVMVSAMAIGSVVCIIAALAGDTSQDLKTGYILGATPFKQQIGELIGVVIASLTMSGVLYLLSNAWGYGSKELPAPQAMLMKIVVEGVMDGNLPWNLVAIGAIIAFICELLAIPSLPFAVGIYLPVNLSMGIMSGSIIRKIIEKNSLSSIDKKESIQKGVLYTSGLIAGEGLCGIILAVLAIIPIKNSTLLDKINISNYFNIGTIGSVFIFILLILSIALFSKIDKKRM